CFFTKSFMNRKLAIFWALTAILAPLAPTASAQLTRYALVLNDAPASTQARNIRITGEVDTLLNAVFVVADASQASQLKNVAGVTYVSKMPRLHRSLDAAEQLINVPAAWSPLGGGSNAGAGI